MHGHSLFCAGSRLGSGEREGRTLHTRRTRHLHAAWIDTHMDRAAAGKLFYRREEIENSLRV